MEIEERRRRAVPKNIRGDIKRRATKVRSGGRWIQYQSNKDIRSTERSTTTQQKGRREESKVPRKRKGGGKERKDTKKKKTSITLRVFTGEESSKS